jgi:ferrochelatase
MARKKIGVVLFQLGGPERLESVEPFLYQLFRDPDIINFPLAFLARKPLAKLISTSRARVVSEHYNLIGGGSPIRRLTEQQAEALSQALASHVDAKVVVAMRYWHPSTEEAITALQSAVVDELILLPLYPQYSLATTGSSLKEWNRRYESKEIPVHTVEQFYDHPDYIGAMVERIEEALAGARDREEIQFVFSAHGLPLSVVAKGDPYPRQIEETVRAIGERGGWPNPRVLCYQSRVGPQKWLAPSLTETIERLAGDGVKRMLVIPLSFVTEHIETLFEINIEARELAERKGVTEFRMMPALNDSPLFIRALQAIVLQAAGLRG